MHEPRLIPALEPAGALLQPDIEPHRRFLVGRVAQHADPVSVPRQSQAQIGVFGHIVGIPRAHRLQHDPSEMIGRSAQRNRCIVTGEKRQDTVEQAGIFRSEHHRQKATPGIVDAKRCLQAAQVQIRRIETRKSLSQLQRVRPVLRIIDDDEIATAQRQREVQRLGLRARVVRWHGHEIGQPGRHGGETAFHRIDRLQIVAFADQLDLQPLLRPVQFQQARPAARALPPPHRRVAPTRYRPAKGGPGCGRSCACFRGSRRALSCETQPLPPAGAQRS